MNTDDWILNKIGTLDSFIGNSFPIGWLYKYEMAICIFVLRLFQEKNESISICPCTRTSRMVKTILLLMQKLLEKHSNAKTIQNDGKTTLKFTRDGSSDMIYEIYVTSSQDIRQPHYPIVYYSLHEVPKPFCSKEFLEFSEQHGIDQYLKLNKGVYMIEYIKKIRDYPVPNPFDNESAVSFFEVNSNISDFKDPLEVVRKKVEEEKKISKPIPEWNLSKKFKEECMKLLME